MSFIYDPRRGGIFSYEMNVIPGPGTIFRRQAVMDVIRKMGISFSNTNRTYLSIGCGIAAVDYEFYKMRFRCSVTDWSEEVLKNVDKIYNTRHKVYKIKRDLDKSDINFYDVIGAFEVLEHARDDDATLKEWLKYLKKDGLLILSVPARMKFWSYADSAAGHYRRYEKEQLKTLLECNGLTEVKILSSGFPFMVILLPLARAVRYIPLLKKNANESKEVKTRDTGLIAPQLYRFRYLIPFRLIVAAAKVQQLFYKMDLGYDYVAVGRKIY